MEQFIESQKARVEAMMAKRMEQSSPAWPPKLAEAVRYSLFAGGKRLRPVLALTVVEMLGRDFTKYENLFISLECIHTYSLIHDDLPSMDNDDLRRGMPTSHKKFGEAAAILAGDALLTYAFELLSDERFAKSFAPQHLARCIHDIAVAAGPAGMVGGQHIDTCAPDPIDDESSLERMHTLKTARLLAASVTSPAILGGSHSAIVSKLADYGNSVGLAFQICDDILNVVGSESQLGKAVGSDEKMGKTTYPKLLGLDAARAKARALCDRAKRSLDSFPPDRRKPLELLANYIVDRMK